MLAVGPDLSTVHRVDAFGERFQRLVPKDNSAGAASEGINNEFAVARAEEQDGSCFRLQRLQFAEDVKAVQGAGFELRADDHDVGLAFFNEREGLARPDGGRNDRNVSALRSERTLD